MSFFVLFYCYILDRLSSAYLLFSVEKQKIFRLCISVDVYDIEYFGALPFYLECVVCKAFKLYKSIVIVPFDL